MGFLKRFLSLGSKSKKNKKKQNAASTRVDAEGRIVVDRGHQDPDTSANRLLRSSSTKFSVMSEIDYTSLLPLPHHARDLLPAPSLSPSPSMATVSTTPGLQRSGTYVVKVHGRTTHSRTEFPRANPPASPTKSRRKQPKTPARTRQNSGEDEDEDELVARHRLKEVKFTPKDNSRICNLRRDPSVASLLNLYDDRGCLDSNMFENSTVSHPPTSTNPEGREPTKRTGSTLRELLGDGPGFSLNTTAEGDISWAERLLNEQLGNDSPLSSPSLNLETPKDALFPDSLSVPPVAIVDTTISSLDPDSSMNYPAISSMEVEVSGSEDFGDLLMIKAPLATNVHLPDPKTPQRASEVFGFLTRRNTLTLTETERDLLSIPQILTPECAGDGQRSGDENVTDTSLEASHSANTSGSTQLTSSDTNSNASHAQIQTATMTKLSSAFAASTTSLNLLISQDTTKMTNEAINDGPHHEVTSNQTGITMSSFLHATSHQTGSSLASSSCMELAPSKIPRGPRPRPISMCKPSEGLTSGPIALPVQFETESTSIQQRDADDVHARRTKREAFTNIPQRQHRRATSRSSVYGIDAFLQDDTDDSPPKFIEPSSPQLDAHTRKYLTRPEQTAEWHLRGKENTPSPPHSGRASPGLSSIPLFGLPMATPMHPRVLLHEPPSPASSSELSPVGRDMMNDLRQQRLRARQMERRRGIWMRE